MDENKNKIRELQNLQKTMEKSLKSWTEMEDSMPNGDSVYHLIESVGHSTD